MAPLSTHLSPSAPGRPVPRAARLALIAGVGWLGLAAVLLGLASSRSSAAAAVTHRVGFRATVLGWSSWYGSYDLGAAGVGWCIDHGLAAPDPAFHYQPAIASDLDPDRRAAMAWIVSSHAGTTDPVDAAAVMLAVHDLRGATYPFGRLDVDRLTPGQLAGFGGHEPAVIARAQAVKAAGLAHASLRGPFTVHLTLNRASATTGQVAATVTDAGGRPVVGALVRVEATGAVLDASDWAVSGADGAIWRTYGVADPASPATFVAHASVPDPALSVMASTTVRAQRVARPAWLAATSTAVLSPVVTTTTTVETTTTTTTRPPTTTTTRPPATTTSTIAPSTTTTTTLRSTTPTTAPPTTTEQLPPIAPSIPRPEAPTALPTTGTRTAGWISLGGGLVLVGGALVLAGRRPAV